MDTIHFGSCVKMQIFGIRPSNQCFSRWIRVHHILVSISQFHLRNVMFKVCGKKHLKMITLFLLSYVLFNENFLQLSLEYMGKQQRLIFEFMVLKGWNMIIASFSRNVAMQDELTLSNKMFYTLHNVFEYGIVHRHECYLKKEDIRHVTFEFTYFTYK